MNGDLPSSDKFERLFNLSIDMLCIAGMDGYLKVINPAFAKTLGYTDEEFLARPFLDFVHPDDLDKTVKIYKDQMGQGTVIRDFENRYRHKDGSYRFFSWTSTLDKSTNLIFAAARDITERRRAELKVSQLEAMLDQETIMAVTDKKGVITYANNKFVQVSGYSRDELVGQTHKIVNSGRHSREFFKELWDTITAGKTWTGLIENRKKSGEHYFVHSIITPLYDIGGELESYLAIRFDVTEQFATKDRLTKTLRVLNETGSIAKVGGWELEVATGELTWTDETFEILEVEKKEGQKPILPEGLQLFVDEHKPIIERAVNRAISHGEPYSLELKAKTAKGNVLWVYTNGKANRNEKGEVVTLSGTIQDIEARKQAEMKYEQEKMKSIQSSKLASLGELSAGVAHEINNPLAIIKGSANLITKYLQDPEKLSSKLKSITDSCDRISHIINGLQKFSRASSGQQFAKHSLKQIIDESIKLTEIRAKRHGIEITIDAPKDYTIMCNDVEIGQVFINLINNAIYAIKEKDVRWIKVELTEEARFVVVRVSDSGLGISEDIKYKIFDPFFTTKQTGDGTGLGLSISRGILDEHQASISIDDRAKNTCFVLRFPKIKK